jgi:UDP-2,3-diacylglucosamine hydrolase
VSEGAALHALHVLHEWAPAAHWRAIDFVADLHLAAEHPRTLCAFGEYLQGTQADHVVLLGDVFEVWVGDDGRELAFEHSLLTLLAEAARARRLFFMPGNRDFLVGASLLAELGITALPDPCCLHAAGRRWLLAHGDAQCLGDEPYQRYRTQVRSPAWQQAFLARPLAERIALARAMREESMRVQRERSAAKPGMESVVDLDAAACRALLAACGAREMIHGHTHRPAVHDLGEGLRRHVLSDWDLDDAKAPRAELLRLLPDGNLHRLTPQAACVAAASGAGTSAGAAAGTGTA